MNIYLREMRAHVLGLIFWCLGIVALIASGMAKYATFADAGQTLDQLLAGIPKAVMVVFGMSGFNLSEASGFYGVLYVYIAVMAAVHATLLSANLISKEERDRTSEFLYAKPISRGRAVTGKLLAGLTHVLVLNVVTGASSLFFVDYFSEGDSFTADILLLTAGLLFVQLIFFSVGALVAGIVHRPKAAPSIATSIMFLTFLASYLVNLSDQMEPLKYFSPFKYFDAAVLMAEGQLDPVFVAISVVIVAGAIIGTYRFHNARDLAV